MPDGRASTPPRSSMRCSARPIESLVLVELHLLFFQAAMAPLDAAIALGMFVDRALSGQPVFPSGLSAALDEARRSSNA
jgi:hypothetical protein